MVPMRLDVLLHRQTAMRLDILIVVVHHLLLVGGLVNATPLVHLLLPEAAAPLRRRLAVVRDVLVDIIFDLSLRQLRH